MKVRDLNEIAAEASRVLSQAEYKIDDYLSHDESVELVTMIYITNDSTAGHGIDYVGNISVVASTQRIAIIFLGHHSFYKHDGAICEYEDLTEDVEEILMCLDAALSRWEEQNV